MLVNAGNGDGAGVLGSQETHERELDTSAEPWNRSSQVKKEESRYGEEGGEKNQQQGPGGEKWHRMCGELQMVQYNKCVKYDVWKDK